jgi:hypothetical protein
MSPTVEGWLGNFAEEDQVTASILLDSLRVASGDEIRAGLLQRLMGLTAELPKPLLLLPVRDLGDIDPQWKYNLPVVYQDFPPDVDFGAAPGSEAIVSNVLREIYRTAKRSSVILPSSAALDVLRRRRCRTLLFVGDYAGSGSQALAYLKSWLRNPTVRSWRSFGWIKIHLLLFASSSFAARRLRASSAIDQLHVIEMAIDFASAPWVEEERARIEDLCIRYARPKYMRQNLAFGFGGHGGLFLMTHTVPNNLPAILLQDRGPDDERWIPLFPRRTFPPVLQRQISGYRPRQEFALDLDTIPDRRLAGAFKHGLRGTQRSFLMMLAAIAGNSHDDEAISTSLATSTIKVNDMGRMLRIWGLIDSRNHLTDLGWEALRRARMRPRKIAFTLKGNTLPYYPMQLRRVGDV